MESAVVTVFVQGLSRSMAVAIEGIGNTFGGIDVSDRFSATNHLATKQWQTCWVRVIRALTAIAERPGTSADMGAELLDLQHQLFGHWYHNKDATID